MSFDRDVFLHSWARHQRMEVMYFENLFVMTFLFLQCRKVKEFIIRLAFNFHISPNKTRLGLILYSSDAKKEIDFKDHPNFDGFALAVDALPRRRERTRIDKALLLAYRDFFGPTGSVRRGVLHVAVVMTDGKQTQTPDAIGLDR